MLIEQFFTGVWRESSPVIINYHNIKRQSLEKRWCFCLGLTHCLYLRFLDLVKCFGGKLLAVHVLLTLVVSRRTYSSSPTTEDGNHTMGHYFFEHTQSLLKQCNVVYECIVNHVFVLGISISGSRVLPCTCLLHLRQ